MISEAELAFLRARLDQDEAAARAVQSTGYQYSAEYEVLAERCGPARVLAEVATWRRIMLQHQTMGLDSKYKGTERETGYYLALSMALRAKAYEYREHADYAAAAAESGTASPA